ncbi:MAG: DNA polymerase domain-containing protein [Candidatus Doudnabacteria bacterium]|nr:DNA polymerase domain-containing protein [Candidatus Doudnabacteria bacterium]
MKYFDKELKIGRQIVKVSHWNKIYWPDEGYTKGDLVEYYQKISKYILPYLKDRPESLNRHPNGINGKSFFQKNIKYNLPNWIDTAFVQTENRKINYIVCNNQATLAYLSNLGCIELNPLNSRFKTIDYPDYMVIDLDPEDISSDKVVEAAQAVHKILEKLKVPNFAKTSGASGMHIYVPMGAKYDYEQTKQFGRLVATLAYQQTKSFTSLERMPKNRKKKVYLDFLQNNPGQTLAAPYSVRPKPGATVSTPLEWKEVKKGLDPKKFTIKTILKRLEKKGDLFRPILGKGIDLKKTLSKI